MSNLVFDNASAIEVAVVLSAWFIVAIVILLIMSKDE